ncbi:unnamed protein product [Prorocentrum cordatum]|uniref:DNA/RNA-binding protein Alba-like domain-containing protein n=1 Tax=Prorocentrum cordatum TaxID=2364126 RepID=A0ABN9V075_9DINO|nr:unnamed protein product [Polarella glacialis]
MSAAAARLAMWRGCVGRALLPRHRGAGPAAAAAAARLLRAAAAPGRRAASTEAAAVGFVERTAATASATRAASERGALHVGPAGFDTEKLARDMAERLRAHGEAAVVVVGTNATQEVLRVVENVEADLRSDEAEEKLLAFIPTLGAMREDGPRALCLGFKLVARVPATAAGSPLTMAKTTNVGKVAGAIAERIRADSVVAVRGAGATNQRQALKATAIAREFLTERGDLKDQALALVLRFDAAPAGELRGLPRSWLLTAFPLRG